MSQEETDKDLLMYYSAIESYEHFESLINNNNDVIKVTTITTALHDCLHKIGTIISGENANCPFLVDLFQLKQHLHELIRFINNKKSCLKSKLQPQNELSTNKRQASKPSENEKLLSLVESTIETPRIQGLKEIAGLWEVKKILKSLIILPRSQPQLFVDRKAFNSVLLFGPPGTGKTHIIHALAYEANMKLHSVTVGDLLTPFVGQSEKNIQFLFQHIRKNNADSILFIDELDGFCKKRSDSEQEHSRRIKTELLCQISKMEDSPNMFLICATNCPWDLDSAFLRRFQKRIYIPLPNRGERYELFKLFTRNTPFEINTNHWEYLVDKTDGFSGSDLSNLVQCALNLPILELEDIKIWKMSSDGFYEPVTKADDFNIENIICCELSDLPPCSARARTVEALDLVNSLDTISLTVSKADMKRYEIFNSK